MTRNTWHEYFYQPDEPPAVSRKFWKGVGWAMLFSIPFWILAIVGILGILAGKG